MQESGKEEALWLIYKEITTGGDEVSEEYSPSYNHLLNADNRYTERELLGQGTLKQVFKCYDELSRRYVAYAELKPELGRAYYDAFINEAWLTTRLTHPNIIKTHEVNLDPENKRPYFTMDLKSNHDLRHFVKSNQTLAPKLEAFLKICDAVAYAHSKNTLHLDLKPENIQCDSFGEVVVCDWGLGQVASEENERVEELCATTQSAFNTVYGKVRGTPGYMAPEQITNETKDERTDIFALGAVLFFILTGKAPFRGHDKSVIFKQTTRGDVQADDGDDVRLLAICNKALNPTPLHRYQTVSELKAEVLRYMAGHTLKSERATPWARAYRFIKRHQKMAWMTLLLVVSVSSISMWFYQRAVEQTQVVATTQLNMQELKRQMDALDSEYQIFEKAVAGSKGDLAERLSNVGIEGVRKSLGVQEFQTNDEPIAPLLEASLLLDKSLKLRPQHNPTFEKWVHANFIMLNFAELRKRRNTSKSPALREMYQLAKQFPHFKYNNYQRPSLEQLVEFFEYAELHYQGNRQNLEGILRFDWALRQNKAGYAPVALSVLRRQNASEDGFSFSYDSELSSLVISSKKPFNAGSALSMYHPSLLSYMEGIQIFRLISPSYWDIKQLDNSLFEQVDLSGVHEVKISQSIRAERLKTLLLPADQGKHIHRLEAESRFLSESEFHTDCKIIRP